MSANAKIKFATRMAFVFIALMMLAFVLFGVVSGVLSDLVATAYVAVTQG